MDFNTAHNCQLFITLIPIATMFIYLGTMKIIDWFEN